nr:site-specific integrase [Rhodopseudomonas palustris]
MRLAVTMDEWSEAVRQAQLNDLEQPDRALLLKMFDDAMGLVESQQATDSTRQQADAIQAAITEYKATAGTRERLSGINQRIRVIGDRVAALTAAPAKAPSSEIADLRADLMNEMAKVRNDVQNAHKNQWSADLLSTKIDDYVQAKAKELGGTKHVSTIGPRIRNFLETIGDKPLRDYTRQDFERYRDILDRTPKRAFDRFKTNNLADAAERNEKRARPFEVIDDKTVDDDYLTPVKTFFMHLVRNLWIPATPAIGIVSSRTRESRRTDRPDEGRRAFKPDPINAYFRYIVQKRSRATEDFWLPILALYTGARLNELCQIEPRRIILHNGRWHIDLLTIYDRDEIERAVKGMKKEEKSAARLKLKTASARRQIPIHDDLIKIGFIDFVDQRRNHPKYTRLFPNLRPDQYGYFSSAVGKRLNRDIKSAGAKTDDTSFYSLRHNFAAALERALVPHRTKDRIMGHLVVGAQGHYTDPELEDVETAVIERVSFPGVDIAPYLSQKRL